MNKLLILIVSTGGWPRFPSGRVAFGCSQFSGNCFSRLGYHPSTSFLESEPGPEWSPGVLLVSCERRQPAWTRHAHQFAHEAAIQRDLRRVTLPRRYSAAVRSRTNELFQQLGVGNGRSGGVYTVYGLTSWLTPTFSPACIYK